MTTTNISVQDLVQREVIYCVSSLIHTLTKENKLDEEQALELWTAFIDYGSAKYELELEHDYISKHYCTEDNQYYFGVRNVVSISTNNYITKQMKPLNFQRYTDAELIQEYNLINSRRVRKLTHLSNKRCVWIKFTI